MNILIEATGSLTSGYLIKAIKESGNKVIGSDITTSNHGSIMCDDFIVFPRTNDKDLWKKTLALLIKHKVELVIPSLDETLFEWGKRAPLFKKHGIEVIISPHETLSVFQDKWNTHQFFEKHNIPNPKTSLEPIYEVVKPRLGRGGQGIFTNDFTKEINMESMISQEKIKGLEYTVDTFFDYDNKPVYIVPRVRLNVVNGKSTQGVVVDKPEINKLIHEVSTKINFLGPINFQLFETAAKEFIFIEINPRIAGGMALGIAATENWINLIIDNILNKKTITPKAVKFGLKMFRYYDELFI